MPGMLVAQALTCEWHRDPLGVGTPRPRLSWEIESCASRGVQTAYRIQIGRSREGLRQEAALSWDSGWVASPESVLIEYDGAPLGSAQRCYWRVRLRDSHDCEGPWSETASWEMGLLERSDWRASWISRTTPPTGGYSPPHPELCGPVHRNDFGALPVQYLRRAFALDAQCTRATLYMTARGLYRAWCNGQRVSSDELTPGWTDYHRRIPYQCYDLTHLLAAGENVLAAELGEGWYSGRVGEHRKYPAGHYGSQPWLLGQLRLEHADGCVAWICTDDHWRVRHGPIVWSDLVNGETYDARQELGAWTCPGFDETRWATPLQRCLGTEQLDAQIADPVRVTETLAPRTWRCRGQRSYLIDFGQNLTGRVRLTVTAPAGTALTLRHAEILDDKGDIYTGNLGAALQIDRYICKGMGEETWEPSFTLHGFRYVQLDGFDGDLTEDTIAARVMHADLRPAGNFVSGSALANRLHECIRWSLRGNYTAVPTDCPQRDERLGWLADAHVFAGTAALHFDVAPFFSKWLLDVADAQAMNGAFPDMAPLVKPALEFFAEGAPGWGDGGIILPWEMYWRYGDIRLLQTLYPAMTRWMRYLETHNPSGIRTAARGNDYGDWLSLGVEVDRTLFATAYYALDARVMMRTADALRLHDDVSLYADLWSRIKQGFASRFVTSDGLLTSDTQTAYTLALAFDLIPTHLRGSAARHLTELASPDKVGLQTGFHGTRHVMQVLCDTGHADVAVRLLLREDFPSWGFWLRHGATTTWERWDGWLPERGLQDPIMNSFNHTALGSVGQWLFEYLAGIRCEAPGYRRVSVQPLIDLRIGSCAAEYHSRRGPIRSQWSHDGDRASLQVHLPPNVSGFIRLPSGPGSMIQSASGCPLSSTEGVLDVRCDSHSVTCELAPGDYAFEIRTMERAPNLPRAE
jgi:alpha-L-rhamnosidase